MSADQTREKPTDINTVLAPVAELAAGKPTIHRYIDLDGKQQTIDYGELTDRDPYPIPMPVDREGYGTVEHSAQHWATGYGDWLNVRSAIDRFMNCGPSRLFDFGCATGRFLRHVHTFGDMEAHGCDFAPANLDWVKRYLPGEIKMILNTATPELPYPDHHFDVVTAFSVFTHIDDGEKEWLAELKRITQPEGLLYITIQNEAAWELVLSRPGSFEHLEKANELTGNMRVTRELFESPMPQNRIVLRKSDASIYYSNVWHSNAYVRENWTDQFEILHIADNGHTSFQSPVIMKPN